jgi:hypothetical protein
MSNAKHDSNGRPTIIAISNVDGLTIEPVFADPTSHSLHVEDGTTGSDLGNNGGVAMIDENSVSVLMAESSDGSGSLIELYVDDSIGALLINSA